MKTSTENAVPLEPNIIAGVKEIEPWGIYEQTAWDYVKTMVEEEERYKLLQKSEVTRESLRNVYFEYQNRSVKMVMLPVTIAQNNHLHDFFNIFISTQNAQFQEYSSVSACMTDYYSLYY